jgi:hypothetical protein
MFLYLSVPCVVSIPSCACIYLSFSPGYGHTSILMRPWFIQHALVCLYLSLSAVASTPLCDVAVRTCSQHALLCLYLSHLHTPCLHVPACLPVSVICPWCSRHTLMHLYLSVFSVASMPSCLFPYLFFGQHALMCMYLSVLV